MTNNTENELDLTALGEAAILNSRGETKVASEILVSRLNTSVGKSSYWVWLALLDALRIQKSAAQYENVSMHFSRHVGVEAPPYSPIQDELKSGESSIRNSLILSSSPLDISEVKLKDWLDAVKTNKTANLDLSRMTLSHDEKGVILELKKLSFIFEKLKKIKPKVKLMGDSELISRLDERIKNGGFNFDVESPYWDLRMDFHQFRGEEDEYNNLLIEYSNKFNYCPIDFRNELSIAKLPKEDGGGFYKPSNPMLVLSNSSKSEDILNFINENQGKSRIELSFQKVERILPETAKGFSEFIFNLIEDNSELINKIFVKDISPLNYWLLIKYGIGQHLRVENENFRLIEALKQKFPLTSLV